jgi:hypothetical protein
MADSKKNLTLGAHQDSNDPIYGKILELGITHENYKPSLERSGEQIGQGAENTVHSHSDSPDKVIKHFHPGNSISYTGTGVFQTTYLDKLIHQYKKILSIRIFNCVVNQANLNFLRMNPEKSTEVPILQSLNSEVNEHGAIIEDRIKTDSPLNMAKQEVETKILRFVPKIVQQAFFYIDKRGQNAYHLGQDEGRNIYAVVDGAGVFRSKKTPEQIFETHKTRFSDRQKEIQRIIKYQKIIEQCADKETTQLLKEIEATFKPQAQ